MTKITLSNMLISPTIHHLDIWISDHSFIFLQCNFAKTDSSLVDAFDHWCLFRLFLCFCFPEGSAAHTPSAGLSTGQAAGQDRRQGGVLSVDDWGGATLAACRGC